MHERREPLSPAPTTATRPPGGPVELGSLQEPHTPFRWIAREVRPYRAGIALLASLSAAEVAIRMLLPWPLKAVIDTIAGGLPLPGYASAVLAPYVDVAAQAGASRPLALLLAIVAAGLVIQLGHQLVLLSHGHLQARLGLRMVRDLREQLFAHLQALALVHHDRRPTGDTVHRLEADAGCVEQLALRGLFPLTFSALTLVAMGAILVLLDWRLAAAALAVVPAMFAWMRWRAAHIARHAQSAREAEAAMVSRAFESLAAIRLVKSLAQEPYERRRFSRAAGDVMEARILAAVQDAVFAAGVGTLVAVGTTCVLGLGGYLVLDGAITAGTLLVALTYLGFVYGPLTGIAGTTGSMQQALASVRRVHDVLRLPREDSDRRGVVEPPPLSGRVEYRDVSFSFDDGARVLDDVSFEAEPGQLVALVGPSGSGKTTLVSLLPRFREVTGGAVLVDGRDVRDYTLTGLRRQVAVVLQEAVVLTGTVADNLRYGRIDATDADIEAAARLAQAHDFISALPNGYLTTLSEAGRTLSGGQRQRLSIARAFLCDSPIVIFDEPTAALDAVSERAIVDVLHRLRVGRTIFVIAHRLSTVIGADQILVLEKGRIAARGTHAELYERSSLYRQLAATLVEQPAAGRR